MITVYTVAYNEEAFLPYFIKWYRRRFPNCRIVVYDNESTDNTRQICLDNNVEVISFSTNGQLKDRELRRIKDNCWKDATTEWVVVCDVDELVDIRRRDLIKADKLCQTVFKCIGFNMVNVHGRSNWLDVREGFRDKDYDKRLVFNASKITKMNYKAGCHVAYPEGLVYNCTFRPKLFHFKFMGREYVIKRHKEFFERTSNDNKNRNWAYHYGLDAGEMYDKAVIKCRSKYWLRGMFFNKKHLVYPEIR